MKIERHKDVLLNKFDILNRGIYFRQSVGEAIETGFKKPTQRRTGASNGLDLYLGNNVYVNAPVRNEIDGRIPYELIKEENSFSLRHQIDNAKDLPVHLLPQPDFYSAQLPSGEFLESVGVINIDRLAINLESRCVFAGGRDGCHYCSIRENSKRESWQSAIEDIKLLTQSAMSDAALPARHIYLTGGTYPDADQFLRRLIEVVMALREITSAGIHAAVYPPEDKGLYAELKGVGLNSIALNLELYSHEHATRYMNRKFALRGGNRLLNDLEYCNSLFGSDSVVSGLLVGLEPLSDTIEGVKVISSVGARPLLQYFRAIECTPLADHPGIGAEETYDLLCCATQICESNGTGLSPICEKCQHNIVAAPKDFIPSQNSPSIISYY